MAIAKGMRAPWLKDSCLSHMYNSLQHKSISLCTCADFLVGATRFCKTTLL